MNMIFSSVTSLFLVSSLTKIYVCMQIVIHLDSITYLSTIMQTLLLLSKLKFPHINGWNCSYLTKKHPRIRGAILIKGGTNSVAARPSSRQAYSLVLLNWAPIVPNPPLKYAVPCIIPTLASSLCMTECL